MRATDVRDLEGRSGETDADPTTEQERKGATAIASACGTLYAAAAALPKIRSPRDDGMVGHTLHNICAHLLFDILDLPWVDMTLSSLSTMSSVGY